MQISARTTLAGVIGWPVDHSLSPAIHNAAFSATGLDWVLAAMPVHEGSAAAAMEGVRSLGVAGVSVTMPHKSAVLALVDELDDDACRLGAVNCVTNRNGRLHGSNTDGEGFVSGLSDDFGFGVDGVDCVVLGAGGAARAVVVALAAAGARSVTVVNRNQERAANAAHLAGPVARVGPLEAVGSVALVVNATPVGMAGDPSLPLDPAQLGAGQIVADLVYHPLETPLMRAARAAGAETSNGLSMLVRQAALAFERWTGLAAPLAAMRDGALDELARRDTPPESNGQEKS